MLSFTLVPTPAIGRWRKLWQSRHGENPLILMVQAFGDNDPRIHGLDGALEFPPHKIAALALVAAFLFALVWYELEPLAVALAWAAACYVEFIRNTPFLVQIYFIFFALPLAGVRLDPTPTAIIALGVNGGAYAIEIIRGGVQSIGKGQIEAGLSLGAEPTVIVAPYLQSAVYASLLPRLDMMKSLGLGPECFSYLTSHGAIDLSHIRFLQDVLNRLDDPDDQAAVIHMAKRMFILFADMFRSIPHSPAVRHAA